jgi:hypothetical protein
VGVERLEAASAKYGVHVAGTPQREIHRITGIDRKTIRRYMAIFAARATASANSPIPATIGSGPSDQTPPPPRPPAFQTTPAKAHNFDFARSLCEPHRQWIEEQVRLQRNAQAIYQDLVDEFSFAASYESVKRFVRALRHVDPEQFDRLDFLPAE